MRLDDQLAVHSIEVLHDGSRSVHSPFRVAACALRTWSEAIAHTHEPQVRHQEPAAKPNRPHGGEQVSPFVLVPVCPDQRDRGLRRLRRVPPGRVVEQVTGTDRDAMLSRLLQLWIATSIDIVKVTDLGYERIAVRRI